MITFNTIKKAAETFWSSQTFQKAYIVNEPPPVFSLAISKFSAKQLQENYALLKTWVETLKKSSKPIIGFGYTIEFIEVKHRQLGRQLVPEKLVFETQIDLLQLISKTKDFVYFKKRVDLILKTYPNLKNWLLLNSHQVLNYHQQWSQLLTVCEYFIKNPKPNRYLRELDIHAIDTKFIEQHKPILHELLSELLPVEAINQNIQTIRGSGFEKRYYLKFDEPLIRFRLLDPKLFLQNNLTDLTIPLSQFNHFNFSGDTIFITENKINGLSFPAIADALIIFGLGYGIQSLKNIHWLASKTIIYWGDIDTHGFAMLSQLRSYYPQTQSMLMDLTTLLSLKHLWVTEPSDKRCQNQLPNLTETEQLLYQQLQQNVYGVNIRLEQERVGYQLVRQYLFCSEISIK